MRPALIDNMSWAMAEVYGAVTDRILVNLARHFPYIKDEGEVRGAFEYQARMLGQMGQVNRETADIIMQSLDGADEALRGALETAILDALKTEEPKLRKAAEKGLLQGAGLLPPELSPNQMQAFQAYYQQSADKLNLVNTVMLESTQAAYTATVADVAARIGRTQSILNVGAGEVVTGVSSWNQAMHDAVQKMVANGLTGFIDHGGHKWSPEAYVAMDIRTTMFNTARAAVWERAGQYGADLYQVSSHNGARPLCYPWQGKIISRSDWTGEVEDIDGNKIHVYAQSETSYGEAAGLFGVNCRHYPMTFIPGFSAQRGEPQDPEENAESYALSQQQRGLERKLREEKRDLAVMKAQGADEAAIRAQKAKVSRANSELQSFCDEHDMPRRRSREYTPVNATFPPDDSYDPMDFPTETRDKMAEFFGGTAGTPEAQPAMQPFSGPQHFEFTPARSIDEAEAFARSHFLQSAERGSVSYKGIDLDYANTCNRVLNDVYGQFTPKYKLGKIGPMNAREKLFRSAIETSDACYHWAGDGGLFINPRFYKSAKALAEHKAQIDRLTETVLSGGQALLDSGKYTGAKRAYLEALLRTRRQCVSYSYDFVEGTIVHEMGHMLDDKLFRKVMKAIGSPLSVMGGIDSSRTQFGGGISGYAVSSNPEYIAESFTAWWYGETDRLDPDLVRVFEEAMHFVE